MECGLHSVWNGHWKTATGTHGQDGGLVLHWGSKRVDALITRCFFRKRQELCKNLLDKVRPVVMSAGQCSLNCLLFDVWPFHTHPLNYLIIMKNNSLKLLTNLIQCILFCLWTCSETSSLIFVCFLSTPVTRDYGHLQTSCWSIHSFSKVRVEWTPGRHNKRTAVVT